MARTSVAGWALVVALAVSACGRASAAVHGPTRHHAAAEGRADRVAGSDWPTFGFDSARTGADRNAGGITAANLVTLTLRRVALSGVVDSAPIELHAVRVRGRRRDVVVVTTTYGRTIAVDPGTGARLWQFTPRGVDATPGNPQVTNTTPVADPGRRYVYAASPDGVVRKLRLSDGRVIWSRRVTLDPRHEKLAGALAVDGPWVVAVTGGYIGDIPPYDGHVVTIDRSDGRIARVFNTMCSDRHRLIAASSCRATNTRGDDAIWSRAGAVVVPGGRDILVTTGNGPFNGRTYWGDSVLELSSDTLRLVHSYTPAYQRRLDATDTDLGSSSPALLGTWNGRPLAVQGGKDGRLHLLDLGRLNGTAGPAGPRLGGELSESATPGSAQLMTQPAVWRAGGRTYAFVADDSGTAANVLTGRGRPRLRVAWQDGTAGTSPVVAGGLLYVYDELDGRLVVRNPQSGAMLRALAVATGHWNSPVVAGGRVIEPTGSYHGSAATSVLDIWHLPGR